MELYALVEKIRDAIKDAATIESWCDDAYDQGHTLYVGVDVDDPPPQTDYPVIVVIPFDQDRSIDQDFGLMTVIIDYAVYDETKTRTDNVVELAGVENILAFRAVVEGVLFASTTDFGGAWIESAPETLDVIENFPIFSTRVAYGFRNPNRFNPIVYP